MGQRTVLYTIKDALFGEFQVLASHNAWWIEKKKVEELINALKYRHRLEALCAYVGITKDQYWYFVEVHPDFARVKEACRQLPFLRSMNSVMGDLDNPKTAMLYLKSQHPDFNPKLKQDEEEKKEEEPVDMSKVENAINRVADAMMEEQRLKKEQLKQAQENSQIINSKEMAQHLGRMIYILSEGSQEEMVELMESLRWDITSSGMQLPVYQNSQVINSGVQN